MASFVDGKTRICKRIGPGIHPYEVLRHEADVRAAAHGLGVEGAVLLAVLHHLPEDEAGAAVRGRGLEVGLLAVHVPHLASADG